jgi:hypothetical protein
MVVLVSIPRQKYRTLRLHLFKGQVEQGCFLFAQTYFDGGVVRLHAKEIHRIHADKWDEQSEHRLELKEEEKVKVMLKAKKLNYDLIECHSHRFCGSARLSSSDKYGLDEFVKYVWWKLPGKIYGALVWTESDVAGQVWLPKNNLPVPIREIKITAKL